MQLEIRPDPAEVGRARRWVRSRIAGSAIRVDEPLAETLILLVSELVTNAVVHTGSPAVLRLSLPGTAPDAGAGDGTAGQAPATVRLEVADTSARPPRPRCVDNDETGGRGLALVDGLADRWGWSPEGAGKRIWCEVDRSSPHSTTTTTCETAPATFEGGAGAYCAGKSAYEDLAYEAV
ncbi:ATP-binding protein [Streptomyces sp. NBC_00286]|uniref:ATP-binding protein n=1 Tax=Streptomyces sp. NBC_00286 TaxID=2975701 RepID=UPI002E2E1D6E|nr:ATP-binding protein [Streptomyces sp. NBC_00286]